MRHYESFNDPFECRCEILSGFPPKDPASTRFRNILTAWGFDDPYDPAALDHYDDYVFSLEGTEPSIPHLIDEVRICCFSKSDDNLLLWSHYADGLRGFCIEYDQHLILTHVIETAQIYDVIYSESPAVVDTAVISVLNDQIDFHGYAIHEAEKRGEFLGQNTKSEITSYKSYLNKVFFKNSTIYQNMLATKPREWRYEEEIRIIAHARNSNLPSEVIKYPFNSVKSLTIGEKMPMNQKKELIQVLEMNKNSIPIKIAKRKKGKFKIEIKQL